MTRSLGAAAIGVFFLIYIVPLGIRPMVIPDETRYAEVPREMVASGDWVVPRLNGLRYFEKPILGYWLNGAAMLLFGENAFAVRFPSAMAVGLSSLLVFLLVRKFEGGHGASVLAAVGLFTSVEVYGVGIFNVLDNLLSLFITAGMVSFFFAHMEAKPRRRLGFLALFGLSCGLAFLTKGFVAFAVPVVAVVPFMIWERRWKDLFKAPWLPMVVAVLVALPWAVMIHIREPNFWHYFFWTEHIKRFLSDNAQHAEPFWFFMPFILGGGTALDRPFSCSDVRGETDRLQSPSRSVCCLLVRFPVPFLFRLKRQDGHLYPPMFPSAYGFHIHRNLEILECGQGTGVFCWSALSCRDFGPGGFGVGIEPDPGFTGPVRIQRWGTLEMGFGDPGAFGVGRATGGRCQISGYGQETRSLFYCPVAMHGHCPLYHAQPVHRKKGPRQFLDGPFRPGDASLGPCCRRGRPAGCMLVLQTQRRLPF